MCLPRSQEDCPKSLVSALILSVSPAASTAPHRELSKNKSHMGVQQRAHI